MIDARNIPLMIVSAGIGAVVVSSLPGGPGQGPAHEAVVTSAGAPSSAAPADTGKITNAAILKRENDGHFWAQADVEGTSVKFMVDTGASTVALTYRDAQRLGLKPETLDFRWSISTAGGETKGASVLLDSIRIGQVEVQNVEAMVLDQNLEQSLLGMTFLGELYSYEFRQRNLIIRQ
ncbi:MAG: TIGR02281 family clan AA aspartic protease [Pseudomonadota bacterium]